MLLDPPSIAVLFNPPHSRGGSSGGGFEGRDEEGRGWVGRGEEGKGRLRGEGWGVERRGRGMWG